MIHKKVLLIMLPEKISRLEYPNLGILYLSAMLEKENVQHAILDLRAHKNWRKKLSECAERFDIFGIACTSSEACHLEPVSNIIKKNNKRSRIIVGGVHPTLVAKEILREIPSVDYCLRGEGEYSFIEFLKEKPIEKISGFVYRSKGKTFLNRIAVIDDLNKIPFPNYEKINMKYYLILPRTFQIITSRGCPFQCTYCSKALGDKFRPRSPKNVVDEMEYFKKRYGARVIKFIDDNFSLDLKRAKDICRGILKRELNIRWWCSNGVRIDKLDRELLSLMKKSGCIGVALGIESISDKVLKMYKKSSSKAKIIKAINMVKEFDMPIDALFLVSGIGETKGDVISYLDFAKEYNFRNVFFSLLIPFPKSEVHDWITKNNYWVVKNPLKAITQEASTSKMVFKKSKSRALFETPEMSAREKEKVFNYVVDKWAEHISKRSFIRRISYYCRKFHLDFVFDLFEKHPALMRSIKNG